MRLRNASVKPSRRFDTAGHPTTHGERAAARRALIAAAPDLRELAELTHSPAWLVMAQLVDDGQMVWRATAPTRLALVRRLVDAGCASLSVDETTKLKTLRATPRGTTAVRAWRAHERAMAEARRAAR